MKTFLRRSLLSATMAATGLLFVLLSARAAPARDVDLHAPSASNSRSVRAAADVAGILKVLKHETSDPALLKKAEEKLRTMPEKDVRLLASLCTRIARSGDERSGEAHVAFSLVTMLLVLS